MAGDEWLVSVVAFLAYVMLLLSKLEPPFAYSDSSSVSHKGVDESLEPLDKPAHHAGDGLGALDGGGVTGALEGNE